MKEALDRLIDSLSNGNLLLAGVIVAVALIFNYKKIVDFLEDRRKAKLVKLSDALKCEYIRDLTRSHLEEELATEHFKLATGIRLEKEFRDTLIAAHRSTKGELSFIHFKRALPHLHLEDSELSVHISIFEKVGYMVNLVSGFTMAIFGLLLLMLPGQIKGIKLVQALSIFGMGAIFIAIALFMLYQTTSVVSAKKISKVLKKPHNDSMQPTADASAD